MPLVRHAMTACPSLPSHAWNACQLVIRLSSSFCCGEVITASNKVCHLQCMQSYATCSACSHGLWMASRRSLLLSSSSLTPYWNSFLHLGSSFAWHALLKTPCMACACMRLAWPVPACTLQCHPHHCDASSFSLMYGIVYSAPCRVAFTTQHCCWHLIDPRLQNIIIPMQGFEV